jgi:hypothetical protein
MQQPARSLDAATGSSPVRRRGVPDIVPGPNGGGRKAKAEHAQNRGMAGARQARKDIEQRQDEKHTDEAQGRP